MDITLKELSDRYAVCKGDKFRLKDFKADDTWKLKSKEQAAKNSELEVIKTKTSGENEVAQKKAEELVAELKDKYKFSEDEGKNLVERLQSMSREHREKVQEMAEIDLLRAGQFARLQDVREGKILLVCRQHFVAKAVGAKLDVGQAGARH